MVVNFMLENFKTRMFVAVDCELHRQPASRADNAITWNDEVKYTLLSFWVIEMRWIPLLRRLTDVTCQSMQRRQLEEKFIEYTDHF